MKITVSSDISEPYMSYCNPELIPYKFKIGDEISFDLLKKLYGNYHMEEMHKHTKIDHYRLVNLSNIEKFRKCLFGKRSEGFPIEDISKDITKRVKKDFNEIVLADFAGGKGINSYIWSQKFKHVVCQDIQCKELYIAMQINSMLGEMSNITYYLGDIQTSHKYIMNKYKPDYVVMLVGYGLMHIKEELTIAHAQQPDLFHNDQERYGEITKQSKNIIHNIFDKYQVPFLYQ